MTSQVDPISTETEETDEFAPNKLKFMGHPEGVVPWKMLQRMLSLGFLTVGLNPSAFPIEFPDEAPMPVDRVGYVGYNRKFRVEALVDDAGNLTGTYEVQTLDSDSEEYEDPEVYNPFGMVQEIIYWFFFWDAWQRAQADLENTMGSFFELCPEGIFYYSGCVDELVERLKQSQELIRRSLPKAPKY